MIRIRDLKLELHQANSYAEEIDHLRAQIIQFFHINPNNIQKLTLTKKAVDARKKSHVFFVYSVDLQVQNESDLLSRKYPNIAVIPENNIEPIVKGDTPLTHRPVVVGFGPSGMFSALLLAKQGYRPLVLERGLDVEHRMKEMNHFYQTGEFSEQSSILFGEGGAGTYSDGKLTTMINDFHCQSILETLVEFGANPEILYINKPHIGTDQLRIITKRIREEIIRLGGEVRFNALVSRFVSENLNLAAVMVNHSELIPCEVCLLGTGHSARDTFSMLYDQGFPLAQKPFSIGVRIEHLQKMVNLAQYGEFADSMNLGAADYKLAYHSPTGRSAYTFCMCPGGYVVCSTSEAGGVVTNGMSESLRNGENANSALLVNVVPSDFASNHPLSGIDYQRQFERKAFALAGKNYHAPVQLVGDFMQNRQSTAFKSVRPTYVPGTTFVKMTDIFPPYITDTLKAAILDFDKKLKGFGVSDAILTGVETRSSSPVRIIRDDHFESAFHGVFPMGEGAGYAGGIMSSAVDGLKVAEEIIRRFHFVK